MKIYEKPMAIIEKIDVEDVITTSEVYQNTDVANALKNEIGATDQVILFQW